MTKVEKWNYLPGQIAEAGFLFDVD